MGSAASIPQTEVPLTVEEKAIVFEKIQKVYEEHKKSGASAVRLYGVLEDALVSAHTDIIHKTEQKETKDVSAKEESKGGTRKGSHIMPPVGISKSQVITDSAKTGVITPKEQLAVGEPVEARLKGSASFYGAKVLSANEDGTYKIEYNGGDVVDRVKPDVIRKPAPGEAKADEAEKSDDADSEDEATRHTPSDLNRLQDFCKRAASSVCDKFAHQYCVALDGSKVGHVAYLVALDLRKGQDKLQLTHIYDPKKKNLPVAIQPETIKSNYEVALVSTISDRYWFPMQLIPKHPRHRTTKDTLLMYVNGLMAEFIGKHPAPALGASPSSNGSDGARASAGAKDSKAAISTPSAPTAAEVQIHEAMMRRLAKLNIKSSAALATGGAGAQQSKAKRLSDGGGGGLPTHFGGSTFQLDNLPPHFLIVGNVGRKKSGLVEDDGTSSNANGSASTSSLIDQSVLNMLGSVSDSALRQSLCPVIIAKRPPRVPDPLLLASSGSGSGSGTGEENGRTRIGQSRQPGRMFVLCIDGSTRCEVAFHIAVTMIKPTDHLEVVFVNDLSGSGSTLSLSDIRGRYQREMEAQGLIHASFVALPKVPNVPVHMCLLNHLEELETNYKKRQLLQDKKTGGKPTGTGSSSGGKTAGSGSADSEEGEQQQPPLPPPDYVILAPRPHTAHSSVTERVVKACTCNVIICKG